MRAMELIRSNPAKFGLAFGPDTTLDDYEAQRASRDAERLRKWYAERSEKTVEDLIVEYTSGCCGVLAEVLRQRLGWPVIGVFLHKGDRTPTHVGLQNPETGLYVDAHGFERTTEQFLSHYDRWPEAEIRLVEGPTPFQQRHITHQMCVDVDLNRLFPGRFDAG